MKVNCWHRTTQPKKKTIPYESSDQNNKHTKTTQRNSATSSVSVGERATETISNGIFNVPVRNDLKNAIMPLQREHWMGNEIYKNAMRNFGRIV